MDRHTIGKIRKVGTLFGLFVALSAVDAFAAAIRADVVSAGLTYARILTFPRYTATGIPSELLELCGWESRLRQFPILPSDAAQDDIFGIDASRFASHHPEIVLKAILARLGDGFDPAHPEDGSGSYAEMTSQEKAEWQELSARLTLGPDGKFAPGADGKPQVAEATLAEFEKRRERIAHNIKQVAEFRKIQNLAMQLADEAAAADGIGAGASLPENGQSPDSEDKTSPLIPPQPPANSGTAQPFSGAPNENRWEFPSVINPPPHHELGLSGLHQHRRVEIRWLDDSRNIQQFSGSYAGYGPKKAVMLSSQLFGEKIIPLKSMTSLHVSGWDLITGYSNRLGLRSLPANAPDFLREEFEITLRIKDPRMDIPEMQFEIVTLRGLVMDETDEAIDLKVVGPAFETGQSALLKRGVNAGRPYRSVLAALTHNGILRIPKSKPEAQSAGAAGTHNLIVADWKRILWFRDPQWEPKDPWSGRLVELPRNIP